MSFHMNLLCIAKRKSNICWSSISLINKVNGYTKTSSHPNQNLINFMITRKLEKSCPCSPGTVSKTSIWNQGISKQGILQSPISHVLNLNIWIKLVLDTLDSDVCDFFINEFNSTFRGKWKRSKMANVWFDLQIAVYHLSESISANLGSPLTRLCKHCWHYSNEG